MALYYLILNPELPDENFVIKIHSKYGHFHFSKNVPEIGSFPGPLPSKVNVLDESEKNAGIITSFSLVK